ncbi:MAG: 7TM diverse intracellular signaling domain-containing protein, partial [Acidaminobacteraceae bacterium]
MPEIATAYKLFIDGTEVFGMGTIGRNESEHIAKFKTDTVVFKTSNDEFDVVIQISNFDYRIFGMLDNIAIANSETIKGHNDLIYSKSAALSSGAFILAVFYISIYIWLRKNNEYLYFALFAFVLAVRTLTYDNKLLYEFFDLKWKTQLDISLLTTIFSIIFLIQYFKNLYKESDKPFISKALLYIYLLMIIPISMSTGTVVRGYLVNIMIVVEFATVLYFIYILFNGVRKNIEGSILTLVSMLTILIAYYFDVKNGYIQNYITYSLYLLLIMQGVVLGMKFSNSYIRLGEARNDLSVYVDTLRERNNELTESRNDLSEINRNLDKIVLEKTKTVKALLDNGELKVMYINQDVMIGNEYSYNCFEIFGKEIRDLNYIDLMHDESDDDKAFNLDLIKRIFIESDKSKKQVYMSLLPDESNVNNHVLKMAYKLINLEDKELIMIIMDDVTKEREREIKYLDEIREIRAMLSVVLDVSEFKKLANDFIAFWDFEFERLYKERESDSAFIDKMMREVHCQKGNFSIYQRRRVVNKLHYIEEEILSFIDESELEELINILKSHKLSDFIKEDIKAMSKVYGYNISLDENYLKVKESKLIEITNLLEGKGADYELISKVEALRDVSFDVISKKYQEFVSQKEAVLGKEFKSLEINGGNVRIAYSKIAHMNNILNICVRNAIYHGIETPEVRRSRSKKSKGKIVVSIYEEKDKYILSVSDDGAGIDIEKLKQKKFEKDILNYMSISDVTYEDAISMIYEDGVSLAENLSDIAGRG